MKKIVLAYSGGLDTSIILKWLQENYKAEIIAYTADIGQVMDKGKIIKNAKRFGVKKIIIENLKDEFIKKYVLEYFLEKISEFTPNTNKKFNKYYSKPSKSLKSTQNYYNETNDSCLCCCRHGRQGQPLESRARRDDGLARWSRGPARHLDEDAQARERAACRG